MSAPRNARPALPPARTLVARIILTALALAVWFWTQSLIGAKTLPASGLGDGLHTLLAPLNESLHQHPRFADELLIVSSAFIDLLGIFLLGAWIFGKSVRPFLGLVLVLGLRQIFQALVALPPPAGMIWHYPGFPSLLVTYGVANDFFFSGHTAVAVLGAVELGRLGRPWLRWAGGGAGRFRGRHRPGAVRSLHHGRLHRRGGRVVRRPGHRADRAGDRSRTGATSAARLVILSSAAGGRRSLRLMLSSRL